MRILLVCLGLLWGGVVGSATGWTQVLSHSEVEESLDMRLRAILEEAGNGLYVTVISSPSDLKLPNGVVSWKMGDGVEQWEPGQHTLPVTVFVGGVTAARLQVSVTLKQRVQTPVLRRDFKRGEVVGQEDVQLADVELASPLSGRVRAIQDVVGKAVTRDVRVGQPLLDRWLEGPVVVERGTRMRVTLIRGALRIETSGVAMQRGRVGEFISIRNPESQSLYDAQVTAPGEAQVRSW